MNDPFGPNHLSPRLRTLRIVHFGLCFGAAAALGILAYQRQLNPMPAPAVPMLTYVALGGAGLGVLLAGLVPSFLEASWRRQMAQGKQPGALAPNTPLAGDPVARWAGLYQTRLILRAAMLEGPIFLQAIAFVVEGSPVVLGVGIGLWVLLILQYPTLSGMESWIDTQENLLQQSRGLD
jgi:hypothetical protein